MDLSALIQECAPSQAPQTIASLIEIESHANPWSIGRFIVNQEGERYTLTQQPHSKEEAVSWARWLVENKYRFDAGLMQINSQHFARFGINPETLFEPCTNIHVGASIFNDNYKRAHDMFSDEKQALLAAISAYNTGDFQRGFSNGYVGKFSQAQSSQASINTITPPLIPTKRNSHKGAPKTKAIYDGSTAVASFSNEWSTAKAWLP